MPLTLLVDGDINIFRACSASEKEVYWPDLEDPLRGLWTLHSDPVECQARVDADFRFLIDLFEADEIVIALSDTNREGIFRKDVWPTYKSNRKPTRKPIAYWPTVDYVKAQFETFERSRLEGDDVLGILATSNKIIAGDKVIVSLDKDMQTVPCNYFKGEIDDDGKTPIVHEISEEEADHFHLLQTLAGDAVDGYPGCPSIGMTKAAEILSEPRHLVREEYQRKGELAVRWVKGEECSPWEAIVDQYAKQGLNPQAALVQAQCARILRASDYNFKNKEPVLWTPSLNS